MVEPELKRFQDCNEANTVRSFKNRLKINEAFMTCFSLPNTTPGFVAAGLLDQFVMPGSKDFPN